MADGMKVPSGTFTGNVVIVDFGKSNVIKPRVGGSSGVDQSESQILPLSNFFNDDSALLATDEDECRSE